MENEKLYGNLPALEQNPEQTSEELAKLFDYPSIGELFSDGGRRLEDFRAKLTATRDELERIVRYGRRDEADSAVRAVRAVEVTLKFLGDLQNLRAGAKK
ncbi:MAG: hypothetical protein JSS81_18335 [Acidobacteria bacterium]|nr:hypothetical protein [Acidobacteriota bacterium]